MPLTKVKFRENCLKKMKNSSKHNKYYKDSLVNLKLLKELKSYRGKKILFYYPLTFEANVRKSINHLRKTCDVFIPFMQGTSFKMVPFRLPLKQNKFGIFEAGNSLKKLKYIDIAIVPTVGVDVNLQRVGFGKGMYDRFFEKLKKKPYTIFIQPEFCYTDKSICDSYDVTCDLLLTPKVQLVKRGK